ncbi:hypothetical protein F7Q99_34025 [Streptomyces kaniharaensis]|uniref:STAS domain-containing protein n=2 Tax=Streptomyces kaniharaensis TaxID=212423 RepID=A0A6N7L4B8_9ACTN|nr:hypothetical protein [Streptomyces kaniharaensis]
MSGFLGDEAVHRFAGAFDWIRARCAGPIVLDLAALRGWSNGGEGAIVHAAALLAPEQGPLAVCGLGERSAPLLLTSHGLGLIRLYPDIAAAVTAIAAS